MNIFLLSGDPREAARMHCDKHVVKMLLETAQILCTVIHIQGTIPPNDFIWETEPKITLYKPTHVNHPCVKWARETIKNYDWLCRLGLALCHEYTRRYIKHHKSERIIEFCSMLTPDDLPMDPFTFPPQCMPKVYQGPNPITAYRRYYCDAKKDILIYTNRDPPSWLPEEIAKVKQ